MDDPTVLEEPTPLDEPTVLDYVKALLMPWRGPRPKIPSFENEAAAHPDSKVGPAGSAGLAPAISVEGASAVAASDALGLTDRAALSGGELLGTKAAASASLPVVQEEARGWPWRAGGAMMLALLAQAALEPPGRSLTTALIFYTLAISFLLLAYFRKEWIIEPIVQADARFATLTVRLPALIVSLISGVVAYITFDGNLFTSLNVSLWLVSIGAFILAFWQNVVGLVQWPARFRAWIGRGGWQITLTPWLLLLVAAAGLVTFFRLYHLAQVPPEMFSDHAEKLADVGDVLNGQYSIFFPRNTGREAFQMYLTAAMALLFDTGLTFMSLKLGTALAGLATLPFIYLLGKEVGNRRVALIALVLAGIAYWPNVISRVALRFTLYPLFTAPTLYFLIRGLRTANRNYLILAGVSLGIGLHGYSPFRFVPLVVVAVFMIYALHRQLEGNKKQALLGLILLAFVAFLVFLPLFRYGMEDPEMFFYRMMTRMGSTEAPLVGSPIMIFLRNFWNAITMFFWSNGETWVHSVVFRPALDIVSAALFLLGALTVIIRYGRDRHWIDLSLLVSVPLLLMPSILSLAFPNENPSLNRTGGALVPVFIIAALALDSFLRGVEQKLPAASGRRLAWAAAMFLVAWSVLGNYDLVFRQYRQQFQVSAWNTSEIGHVIRAFADSVGDRDSAWVVPNAHWVDTRVVGINAGFPEKDFALWPENFSESLDVSGPKLFIIRPSDQPAVDLLAQLYPEGTLSEYQSQVQDKNFLLYFVPP